MRLKTWVAKALAGVIARLSRQLSWKEMAAHCGVDRKTMAHLFFDSRGPAWVRA